MARTLAQIKKQIDKLQKEAAAVRAHEVAGVIARIRTAIDFYGLQPGDLFGTKSVVSKKRRASTGLKKATKKTPSPAKYRDKESGKTWTGHGKRPAWFVLAIEQGTKAEDMLV